MKSRLITLSLLLVSGFSNAKPQGFHLSKAYCDLYKAYGLDNDRRAMGIERTKQEAMTAQNDIDKIMDLLEKIKLESSAQPSLADLNRTFTKLALSSVDILTKISERAQQDNQDFKIALALGKNRYSEIYQSYCSYMKSLNSRDKFQLVEQGCSPCVDE